MKNLSLDPIFIPVDSDVEQRLALVRGNINGSSLRHAITDAPFNEAYQPRLGDTIVFRDGSKELVASLRGKVRQYAVSNGTIIAQTKKLRRSGFDRLMDGVFLSEEIGFEKPAKEFFDCVFQAIGPVDKDRILIVGDSLTSDITGGNRAGIRTCWYNPAGLKNDTTAKVDYEIRSLQEIPGLLS